MKNPPVELRIISGCFALDGGSITLFGTGEGPEVLEINLDWSIGSRHLGEPQLSIDGEPVPRGSDLESVWLSLIRSAQHEPRDYDRPGWTRLDWPVSPNAKVLSSDIDAVLDAGRRGEDEWSRHLADQLINHVQSEEYQNPVPYTPPPTNEEIVRELLREDRRADAIFAYRRGNPSVNIKEAKLTIANLAREYGFEDGLQD